MLAEVSLNQILLRALATIMLTGVHGFTLALIAYFLGDRGPKYDGRLTLNPFAHLSVAGLVSGVASRAGFIQPITIDSGQMRLGRLGPVVCVLGSLALLIVFGVLVMRLRAPAAALAGPQLDQYAVLIMTAVAESAVWFVALNLLPLPPLTGGHLLAAIAPILERQLSRYNAWIGVGIVVVMLATRGVWLQPLTSMLGSWLR